MAFALRSPSVAAGCPIPTRHTCDGEDLSPPLEWANPPAGTAAFALVMDDPDAPSGAFTHWLLADIPADETQLAEGILAGGLGTPGTNDFSRLGYGGPCPPRGHGPHHYRFRLHALSRLLQLGHGFSRADMDAALRGAVTATATLTAVYERRGGRR